MNRSSSNMSVNNKRRRQPRMRELLRPVPRVLSFIFIVVVVSITFLVIIASTTPPPQLLLVNAMVQTSTLKLMTRLSSSSLSSSSRLLLSSSSSAAASSSSKRSPYEYRPNVEMWPVTTTTTSTATTATTPTSTISFATTNPTSLTLMDCFPKDTIQLLSSSSSSTTTTGRRNLFGWWKQYQSHQIRTLVRLSSTFLLFLLLVLQTTTSTTSSVRFMRLIVPTFLQDMSITLFLIPVYAQILQHIMEFPIIPTSWSTLLSKSSNHTITQIILPRIVQEPMHLIQQTKLYRNFQMVGGILQQIIPTSLAFYLLLSGARLLRPGTRYSTMTTTTTTTTLLIAILRFIWTKTMLDLVQFPFPFRKNKNNTVLLRSIESLPLLALPIRGVIVPLVHAGYLGMINYQWMWTSSLTTIAITTGTQSQIAVFSLILAMSNLIYHGIYVFGYLLPVQMIQYMNIYNTCIVCRTAEL